MKQKLLTMLLCFIVGIGSMNAKDIASGTFKNGGTWKISDQGELYIDAVTVPDYKTQDVDLSDGDRYFLYCRGVFNAGQIGYGGFRNQITLAPWKAYASKIKSLRLGANVIKVGNKAFTGLTELKKVTFDSRSTNVEIGDMAFYACWNLEDFDFSHVSKIGSNCFDTCVKLKSNVFPVLKSVGYRAFYNCTELAKIGYVCLSQVPADEEDLDGFESLAYICKRGASYTILSGANAGRHTLVPRNSNFRIIVPIAQYSSFVSKFGVTPFADYTSCKVVCGTDGWYLQDGVLNVLNATGDFASPSDAPWYSVRNEIKAVYYKTSKTVGKNSFKGYTNLTYINSSLHYVGVSAFEGCTNLLLAFDNLSEVQTIGANAFANTHLAKVELKSATIIGSNAFDGAPLTYISLGANLTTIGSQAFRNTLLKGIVVMGSAPTTPNNVFENVTAANVTLTVPANVANTYEISPWNSFTFDKTIDKFPIAESLVDPMWRLFDDGMLMIYKNVPNYSSPQEQPWYNYREFISQIKIAQGVTSIGNYAFAYTQSGVSKVRVIESYFDTKSIPIKSIGAHAFENNDLVTEVSLKGVETIGDQAFSGCTKLNSYTFGANLKSIGSKAFYGCPVEATMSLSTPTPPTVSSTTFEGMGVTAAAAPGRNGAKAASPGQKSVKLDVPDEHVTKYLAANYWNLFTFEYIGEHGGIVESGKAYDGLYVLYSDGTMIVSASAPTDPNNVNSGFSVSTTTKAKIKRLEIQGTLEVLGWQFVECPNLEEVVLGPTFNRLYGSFHRCPKLKKINLDNILYLRSGGTVSVPYGCFEGCTSLTFVDLPNAQEVSGFKGCTSLMNVTLGGSPKLGMYTFQNCTALQNIQLGNADISDAEGCFSGCTRLDSVTFSGRKVPDAFFKGCSSLTSVNLGSQMEEIGAEAFTGTRLERIYVQRPTPPEAETDAFKGLELGDIKLYIPYAFRRPYWQATYWKDMDYMDDEDYAELDFPMYFSIGTNAVGMVDESENLYIDAITGGDIVKNANDYLSPYAPYVLNEIHVGNDVTSLPKGDPWTGMFHWVSPNGALSLVLGSGLKSMGDYSCYNTAWDCDLSIDCYALTPPVMEGDHVFNWNMVKDGSRCVASVRVVNDPAVVAAYRADPYWSKFSIYGTLAPADAPTECTVTFLDWDGKILQQSTTLPGTSVTPPADPERDGYMFRGWDNTDYNWVITDVTVTATYYEDLFTVRFYNWDGTRLSEQQVRYGQAAVAPADPDEREGYIYNGWDTDFSNVTMDLNICASYSPIMFTVTFQDKDGNPITTQQVQYGTSAVAPEAPEVEGYEFVGWDTDFSDVKSDLFVQAVYQEKVSDVVSYVCDFTTMATKHSAYGDQWTYDTDWSVFGGANNNGQWAYAKFGGKSATIANANPVYVVDNKAFGREIKQIRVTYPSGSFSKAGMKANEWGAKVYSDLACKDLVYMVKGGDIDGNGCVLTLTPEAGKPWEAGSVIMVYWDLANTSSTNGIVWVDKIEYLTASDDDRALWNTSGTGIENVQGNDVQCTKVLREGVLYIVRPDGKVYNAQGMRVR